MNKHFCWILNVETEFFTRQSCKIAGREGNIVNKYLRMWVGEYSQHYLMVYMGLLNLLRLLFLMFWNYILLKI